MLDSVAARIVVGVGVLLVLYLWKVNRAMRTTPPEALKYSPTRWTPEECRKTFERIKKEPVNWAAYAPAKQERRYVIVGGSGLVGGELVQLLLAQGHSADDIRIIDFRKPTRDDMLVGPASKVGFAQADVTSSSALAAAFKKPWPAAVAKLPLTVFHTAAVIRPSERSELVYDRCGRVNFGGTANCLAAAREAGASVFIVTSSCSVGLSPVGWWHAPWQSWPENYTQVLRQDDFFAPIRPHSKFFANYARSKAESERLVCAANEPGFRTGAIRPGGAIFGRKDDAMVSMTLRLGSVPTFSAPWMQNWIHVDNASLAHLQYEAALLSPHAEKVAGRPFLVTDPGPPLIFEDFYTLAREVSATELRIQYPPPVLMLILAHLVELYCLLLWNFPFLTRWLEEPDMPLYFLQPSSFHASANCLLDDSDARKSVEDGGIGYKGVCETMEGCCMHLIQWNEYVQEERRMGREVMERQPAGIVKDVIEVGAEPAARTV